MLRGTIYLFLALCGYAVSTKSSILTLNNSFPENQAKNRAFDRQVFHQVVPVNKEKTGSQGMHRITRGIVIVDEDFDVPPGSIRNEKRFKSSEISDPTGYESVFDGSGDETDDSEKEIMSTTEVEKYLKTKSSAPTTEKTSVKEPTKVKLIKTTTISTIGLVNSDLEGSGDNVLQYTKVYTTTEKITTTPTKEAYEPIPDTCLNVTCSSNDLLISFSKMSNLIPEGTNLTFSCKSNNSDYSMLFWYKSNGSTHFLQAFGTEEELLLNVQDTKTIHSGVYKCVKWINKESCCSQETYLTVYEVPQYTYHLIILALITAACLLICIFLAVRQTLSIKKYTDQFVQKHGSVKQQLL